MANKIGKKLQIRLTSEDERELGKRYTENTDAYLFYLKGQYYWNKRNLEGMKKSVEFFDRAIHTDPTYALAYAGLADAYIVQGDWNVLLRRRPFQEEGLRHKRL